MRRIKILESDRTFFLYRVVLPTASTPLRIALVLRWCKTTCDGTGSTLASSANISAAAVVPSVAVEPPTSVRTGELDWGFGGGTWRAAADTSVPLAVVTGIRGGTTGDGSSCFVIPRSPCRVRVRW